MFTLRSPVYGIITYGETVDGIRTVSITDYYSGESYIFDIPLVINNKIVEFRPEGTDINVGDLIIKQ